MSLNHEFKHQIFISYALENENVVNELKNQLENRGFKRWCNESELVEFKKIHDSELFICCATTEYCKSKNGLMKLDYALGIRKPLIYVLFEPFENEEERYDRLRLIFDLSVSQIFKNDDIDGIVNAISTLIEVRSNKNHNLCYFNQNY